MDHIDWRNRCAISGAFGAQLQRKWFTCQQLFYGFVKCIHCGNARHNISFERCQALPFLLMFILLTFKHGFIPRYRHCLKSRSSHAWPSCPQMQHATNLTSDGPSSLKRARNQSMGRALIFAQINWAAPKNEAWMTFISFQALLHLASVEYVL